MKIPVLFNMKHNPETFQKVRFTLYLEKASCLIDIFIGAWFVFCLVGLFFTSQFVKEMAMMLIIGTLVITNLFKAFYSSLIAHKNLEMINAQLVALKQIETQEKDDT